MTRESKPLRGHTATDCKHPSSSCSVIITRKLGPPLLLFVALGVEKAGAPGMLDSSPLARAPGGGRGSGERRGGVRRFFIGQNSGAEAHWLELWLETEFGNGGIELPGGRTLIGGALGEKGRAPDGPSPPFGWGSSSRRRAGWTPISGRGSCRRWTGPSPASSPSPP